ncbi:Calx-beta domain-containing protein [Paenibacillus sp. OV219]|uniref:Calx-beta domain-containing protein n=1 Tax=Paenibacillus sp. OV219 TaxID=1884377 RepID=UPI0008B00F5B|nr:carboxypeptidase regulatory-like domain-containing protein [Paenibacillus sp. OV219]SEO83569.1 Uncharacterized conserved protein YfaP, DUF2135 family [Paenibacillus sp. OV219]
MSLNMKRSAYVGLAVLFMLMMLLPQLVSAESLLTPGQLHLEHDTYTVNEGEGALVVKVLRTGGSDGVVTVDFCNCGNSATPGVDYNHVNGTLTFGDGVTEQLIEVPIVDDSIVESLEMFKVFLKNPTGGATIIQPELAWASIIDNDSNSVANGSVTGTVINAVTHGNLSGAAIQVFNSANVSVRTAVSAANGGYSFSLPPGHYKITASRAGYHSSFTFVDVTSGVATFSPAIALVPVTQQSDGTVEGTITNALTGNPVPNVLLEFRSGSNVVDGPVVGSATTSDSGSYSAFLPVGNYTATITGTGYVTGQLLAVSIGGVTTGNQNGTVTPILATDEIRVVLTWGETPTDLDSHVTGPSGAADRFHIYYPASYKHFADAISSVVLDVDDTTSYGPETVTITNIQGGSYHYSVHDYTNRFSGDSAAMSSSGAKVTVYKGSNVLNTFFVPTNTEGTLWHVFDFVDGVVVPVNTMSFQVDPFTVQ